MRKYDRTYRQKQGLGFIQKPDGNDPMEGLANLFDLGIVFALGFMVSLIAALNLLDIFNPESKVTITTERKDGIEVMIKEGAKTTIRRMTKNLGSGDGQRLGTAYKLADGSVIYVPEENESSAHE